MTPLILTLALANPITRFYDVTDLISPPPQFINAPRFSVSLGLAGSIPVVANDAEVIRWSNKKRLEDIIMEMAYSMDEYDTAVRWWGNSMIVTGSRELHRRVQ